MAKVARKKIFRPSPNIHFFGDGRGERSVYLNGKKVERCVFVNIRRGFVKIVACDEAGRLLIDSNGNVVTKKIRGNVSVRFFHG